MSTCFFLTLLLIYPSNTVLSYYIREGESWNKSPILAQRGLFNGDNGARYRVIETPEEEEMLEYLAEFDNGATDLDKRVTADQINNLLRNAWLGR